MNVFEENVDGGGVVDLGDAWEGLTLLSALASAGNWTWKSTYRTVWAVTPLAAGPCSHSYVQGSALGPGTGERCWSLLSDLWWAFLMEGTGADNGRRPKDRAGAAHCVGKGSDPRTVRNQPITWARTPTRGPLESDPHTSAKRSFCAHFQQHVKCRATHQ